MGTKLRVALVHDWLNQVGGAEAVLDELHLLFPDAPVYCAMYWREAMPTHLRQWDIRTTWLDRIPWSKTHHQWFLPVYPHAYRSIDLADYDLVISNKSGFCMNVRVPDSGRHLCYCLTPTRYVWNFEAYVRGEEVGPLARRVVPPLLPYLRSVEYAAAQRVTGFAAISGAVQQRIQRHYGRSSCIVHPPVDTARPRPTGDPPADYFLVVSRLVPYKRIDLVVEAFSRLGLPLVIIGDGRDRARLEARAQPNVKFLGRLDTTLTDQYRARCRAFVFPGEDDFGIAPVEAMAAGRPVIAYASGGALDTVVEGISGTFFHELTTEALLQAVRRFESMTFDAPTIQNHARAFGRENFRAKFLAFVEHHLGGQRAEGGMQ